MINKLKKALKDPRLAIRFSKLLLIRAVNSIPVWSIIAFFSIKGVAPVIKNLGTGNTTIVDSFWSRHTMVGPQLAPIKTAYQSRKYLEWRSKQYPLFTELMQLYGEHDNEVVLDYGCGPANDLVGFLINTKAKKVIGIDVSMKALQFAGKRIALHRIPQERCELIAVSDSDDRIPLEDNSVDYIYCEGVLHHISDPQAKLREFYRILKLGGHACVMVYNADSIWLHLYVVYKQMILEGRFQDMDLLEAFARTTDTEDCPIARCYRPEEFLGLCENAGFNAVYVGGYFSGLELQLLWKYYSQAMNDERLGEEHRQFLRDLTVVSRITLPGSKELLQYRGKYAGIGGVYKLYKK